MKRSKARLRSKAEAQLAQQAQVLSPERPAEELLHELQVHQIELEMQNEELRRAQLALEETRDRYVDLYEFAPVGYLTLAADGGIAEINLTGAKLLGKDRARILRQRFSQFVVAEDRERYYRMFLQVMESGERQACPLALMRSDGSVFHAQIDCLHATPSKAPMIRLGITDLTERRRAEMEIESLAFYDSLTHLPNRRLLLDRLLQTSIACSRTHRHAAILAVDLDGFKLVNDMQGHDVGDLLLQQAAQRFTSCVREGDTVGRMGGDEFVILLKDLNEDAAKAASEAKMVGEKILTALAQPYLLGGQPYRSTGSMGITLVSKVREPEVDLLKRADLALYHAKSSGGAVLRFFDPELQAAVKIRVRREMELRYGLEERQFIPYYQPQVDAHGMVTGAEVLLRWQHPTRGLLTPADFIPLAEEKGLILSLGQVVLEAACQQLARWSDRPETAKLTLAVNVSAYEFCQADLVPRVADIIASSGADPSRLILELTESMMLCSLDETVHKMNNLKQLGLRFALDDFGIGFSSLAYLKSLPFDQLKVDRSFVSDIITNASDAAIVRTIMTLGQSLGLAVIAEGVETEEQLRFLEREGCRAYQGYLFGRPSPVEGFRFNPFVTALA